MQKIVLASNNQKKVKELSTLLFDAGFIVVPQSDFNIEDADETGLTFVENALIKARHAAKISKLPAIADDSGLAVESLQGQPGIYSARYSGEKEADEQNNQKLLTALQGKKASDRKAFFYCALVFIQHENDPTPIICEGKWNGEILEKPAGKGGFGYDPLFYVPSHQCSSAELTAEQKNQLSHRGIALSKLIARLKNPS